MAVMRRFRRRIVKLLGLSKNLRSLLDANQPNEPGHVVTTMRDFGRLCAIAAVVALPVGACSTSVTGGKDRVAVSTPGVSGARCEVFGAGQDQVYPVMTPGSVLIPRSQHAIVVACEEPTAGRGQTVVRPGVERWTWGNAATAGLGVGIDWATGAIYDYPDLIEVRLIAQGDRPPNGGSGQSQPNGRPVGGDEMAFAFTGTDTPTITPKPPEPNLDAPIPEPLNKGKVSKRELRGGATKASETGLAFDPPPTPPPASAELFDWSGATDRGASPPLPPKIAPAPIAPVTPVAPQADGFGVQLAAYSSAANAERGWKLFRRDLRDLLGGRAKRIVLARVGGRIYHRLYAEAASRADAKRLCQAIKSAKFPCIVKPL